MHSVHPVIKLLAISGFFVAIAAQAAQAAPQCGQTAQLINARLSYMKDVAGYKAENHLPIEDIAQEEKVIDKALAEAESLGLNAASIKPFMVAQINAAKAIQYRYRADWLSQPETHWQPKPLDTVRTQIGELSSKTLKQVAEELKTCDKTAIADKSVFIKTIRQHNLHTADVDIIFSTFTQITLK
ncbi:chorismate mutase [Yersinia mollaretii]|uniref:chorismate mutase n=1 Tax=Yersinia mollaretii TaxID=33060 RepID=UPI0005E0D33C|nr:chorismate mutase [Yersinia mollaretii]PJE88916.1 chorismate mutase [Yersinia mollaretii]CQD34651.1 chorismate mutase [Yersinia mollaretii]CQH15085.1 chorismate mutase [Yersinia mollaretii]